MAQSATNAQLIVTVGSATQSDHLTLSAGNEYMIQCIGGTYVLDLQVSTDGTNWSDCYYDATNKVTLGTVKTVVVPGGAHYRMDVDTWNQTITMTANRI